MTIKLDRFSDDYLSSPVMREFIRLTGYKNEQPSIQKTAQSIKTEPSTFAESLLILCSELRSSGFTSYASEIEQRFLLLKQAEAHLYNTHDETGDDLVEFAHPGGGNKDLDKGWDELGEVETILEKHKKMLEVVNKEPAGVKKQASIASIAKIILAQDAGVQSQIQQLQSQVKMQAAGLKRDFDNVVSLVKQRGGISWYKSGLYDTLVSDIDDVVSKHLDLDALDNLSRYINTVEDIVTNTVFNKQDVKDIAPLFERIKRKINNMIVLIKQANELELGTVMDAGGEGGTEAGAKPTRDAGSGIDATFSNGMESSNVFLGSLSKYEAKAGADPKKLDILHKTETTLRTFVAELQELYAAVKSGVPFATAAAKTTMFKVLTNEAQLQGDINGFFLAATKVIDYMKTW